jgi:hypothetical protein
MQLIEDLLPNDQTVASTVVVIVISLVIAAVILGGGALLLWLIDLPFAIARARRRKELLRTSVVASATILSLHSTYGSINRIPVNRMRLAVHPSDPAQPDFEVEVDFLVPRLRIFRTGQTIAVRYNPAHPETLEVEHVRRADSYWTWRVLSQALNAKPSTTPAQASTPVETNAVIPHTRLKDWVAVFLACTGLLILTMDVVLSNLVFGAPILSAPLFLFKWATVAGALCLVMSWTLALPRSLPAWARALLAAGFALAYLALVATTLISSILAPISADSMLAQALSVLFYASLGVLLLCAPLSALALTRSLGGRRPDASPSRVT